MATTTRGTPVRMAAKSLAVAMVSSGGAKTLKPKAMKPAMMATPSSTTFVATIALLPAVATVSGAKT